jgi:coenzyme F420-dependent glucose-6-phosphate dehydrogenase
MHNQEKSLGYMCYPDHRDPKVLLTNAAVAEKAGFSTIWVTDHFLPWFHTGAFACNSWVWMSTALQIVPRVPFGTAITAPILRYHPAIVAQAFATMQLIHGERVILGVGTGESMNEIPLGFNWPGISERRERTVEAIKIIRELWKGDHVNFRGQYYRVNASLYMRASVPVYIAASGPKMAKVVGEFGDGFICNPPTTMDYAKQTLFSEIQKGTIESGRSFDKITKMYELDITFAKDYDQALASLKNVLAPITAGVTKPISDPRELESLSKEIHQEDLERSFVVGTKAEDYIKRIEGVFDAGFDQVCILSFSPDEEQCIQMFRDEILPYFFPKNS